MHITISAGVAVMTGADIDAQGIIARADKALYVAKVEGRNRVCVAPGPTAVAPVK